MNSSQDLEIIMAKMIDKLNDYENSNEFDIHQSFLSHYDVTTEQFIQIFNDLLNSRLIVLAK